VDVGGMGVRREGEREGGGARIEGDTWPRSWALRFRYNLSEVDENWRSLILACNLEGNHTTVIMFFVN